MKVLVLGGAGLQGRAVLHDLSKSTTVKDVVCADRDFAPLSSFGKFLDMGKIKMEKLDIRDRKASVSLMRDNVDVVIDVLPKGFVEDVNEAILEAGVNMVKTSYRSPGSSEINERALAQGITILPECGLDPGIDLVLCGYGVSQMDEVHELHSYCGGFPESTAANNPFKYKITWTWNGVLLSYKRPAKLLKEGRIIDIPANDQHAEQWIDAIDFPGVGRLELIPNGNAVVFADYLGISKTLRSTSRCSMRWPGHSAFWKKLVDLNFLSDEPVKGLTGEITPHQFMAKHLEPQLQYGEDERDMVAMRNIIVGSKGGKKIRITYDMLDMRDMETGLFAMNRTVGYTASIVAQMLLNGEIKKKGLLTPIRDIPYQRFLEEIRKRGITITENIERE
jgi:saccharopine dehydrogenase-like NADP-dependent oxidoreductase